MNSPWPMVALKKLLRRVSRQEAVEPQKTYNLLGAHWYAQGLYIKDTKAGSQIRANSLYRVEEGDFVYNRLFAWKGSFAVATAESHNCYVSNEFPCFRVDAEKLDRYYLWHYFSREAAWNEALGLSYGATPTSRNRLKEANLLSMQIPLPPLTEQRRIVARIETLAAKVDAARTLREQATAEVEALFASAADKTFEPKSNWRIAKVGDFCEKPQYGYTESATRQPIGPRFLRITDIQNGQVNWESVPFCNCPDPEKYLLRENDILFARTGGTTGKSYLVKECPQAIFASYLIRLRVEKWVTPDYLYCYFQSPSYWQQVIDNKKGTGQPNVNGRKLAEIEVLIPSLPEQHRIVTHLDALQAKLALVQQHQAATQARLDALLPSILDKAFKGEL